MLRRDWKLKQASRSGSHSYVSVSDVLARLNGPFANALDRVNAINRETTVLLEIAPHWSAEEFYLTCTAANPDVTRYQAFRYPVCRGLVSPRC